MTQRIAETWWLAARAMVGSARRFLASTCAHCLLAWCIAQSRLAWYWRWQALALIWWWIPRCTNLTIQIPCKIPEASIDSSTQSFNWLQHTTGGIILTDMKGQARPDKSRNNLGRGRNGVLLGMWWGRGGVANTYCRGKQDKNDDKAPHRQTQAHDMWKVLLHSCFQVGKERETEGTADMVGEQEGRSHQREFLPGDDVRHKLALQADSQLLQSWKASPNMFIPAGWRRSWGLMTQRCI